MRAGEPQASRFASEVCLPACAVAAAAAAAALLHVLELFAALQLSLRCACLCSCCQCFWVAGEEVRKWLPMPRDHARSHGGANNVGDIDVGIKLDDVGAAALTLPVSARLMLLLLLLVTLLDLVAAATALVASTDDDVAGRRPRG